MLAKVWWYDRWGYVRSMVHMSLDSLSPPGDGAMSHMHELSKGDLESMAEKLKKQRQSKKQEEKARE